MHIDLCVELNDDKITPEYLAEVVREFEAKLGGSKAIAAMEYEVTPMEPAARFASTYIATGELPVSGDVWDPSPPPDRTL